MLHSSQATPRKRSALLGLTGLGLLALAAHARADEAERPSYFPLEVGKQWRYKLTVEVEGVLSNAEDERSIAQKVRVRDRDAFLSQDKITIIEGSREPAASDANVVTTETLALEDSRVLVLSEQHAGAAEHVCDPPRLFLDLAALDTVGAVWSWQSTDGRETLVGKVLENGPFVDRRGRIRHGAAIDITSTCKTADGKSATEERKLWLVRGVGIFKEHVVVVSPGAHRMVTDLELEGPREGTAPTAASPTPGSK